MDAKDEMQLVPRGPRLLKHDHVLSPKMLPFVVQKLI